MIIFKVIGLGYGDEGKEGQCEDDYGGQLVSGDRSQLSAPLLESLRRQADVTGAAKQDKVAKQKQRSQ